MKNRSGNKRSFQFVEWGVLVKKRDNYTCKSCGAKKDELPPRSLHAHHIKPWNEFPELRFDIDNGITLCKQCHRDWHSNASRVDRDKREEALLSGLTKNDILVRMRDFCDGMEIVSALRRSGIVEKADRMERCLRGNAFPTDKMLEKYFGKPVKEFHVFKCKEHNKFWMADSADLGDEEYQSMHDSAIPLCGNVELQH